MVAMVKAADAGHVEKMAGMTAQERRQWAGRAGRAYVGRYTVFVTGMRGGLRVLYEGDSYPIAENRGQGYKNDHPEQSVWYVENPCAWPSGPVPFYAGLTFKQAAG